MTDIEIARNTKLENIEKIAENLGLEKDDIELYGKYKAKISINQNKEKNENLNKDEYAKISENKNEKNFESKNTLNEKDGKLILVTAMSPTPLGEGKTTVSIAIADGLRKINKKSILALREPSLGPVFGIKGGATGGGKVQVAPMEDINLHFTGDIHAITAANNLLSCMIDNHIYFGNELKFKKVTWKRCLDLNDRQLRKVETGLSGEKKIVPRMDGFDISVASEIMAILCLSKDLQDLKKNLGEILIGFNEEDEPIFAKQIKANGAMAVLLKDAIKPNLVQTLEHTPAIIHGGPFANIAHGCNSIIATKTAMKLADYTVTEAGFGADLGAEKFLDIKCRKANIVPDVVVIVATIKAIKYHGIENLFKHIDNIKNKFGLNVIVALNKYTSDTDEEINEVINKLEEKNIDISVVTGWKDGGNGAIDIANKIVKIAEKENNFKYIYDEKDLIKNKISKIATEIYGAKNVEYSDKAEEKIKLIKKLGFDKLPICIAKTQYSFSDDAKNLECKGDYDIHIRDIELKAGAKFIVALAGNIMTMPGLPKVPAAENIDIDENGNIVGIF